MKKNDFILIAAALFIAAASLFAVNFKKDSGRVIIRVNGEVFCEKSLSENGEIDINGTNTAVIEDGRVYMKYADCPDKLCIRQGAASDSSKKIVCLPNRVIIEVTKRSDIDTVVK